MRGHFFICVYCINSVVHIMVYGLDSRTAIEGSFSAWGGLGKLDRGLGRGETFFPDSDSDRDSDETFQIS